MNDRLLTGSEIFETALKNGMLGAEKDLMIATANLKAVRLPVAKRKSVSILQAWADLVEKGVSLRVVHSGRLSGPFCEQLEKFPELEPALRYCVRNHLKLIVVDMRKMYLGTANITGAGAGAKSRNRRNFEAGVWTERTDWIDRIAEIFNAVWEGSACETCDRKDVCG